MDNTKKDYNQIIRDRISLVNRLSNNPNKKSDVNQPSVFELSSNFIGAISGWVSSGFKIVKEDLYKERLKKCLACEFFDIQAYKGLGKCNKCGCSKMKLFLPKQSCPINKWDAVDSKP